MKLILQRVARASVEIDGCVENRIGSGLVLFVALKHGDTLAKARQFAAKVAKLAIWPELGNLDKKYQTNVQDNGLEILVVLQQSVYCSFQNTSPCEAVLLPIEQAKPIFQAFVEQLGKEYQEQMVVAATVSEEARVDLTIECPGVFEIDTDEAAPARQARSAAVAEAADVSSGEILPEVVKVTKALQRVPMLQKGKAVFEAGRIFRVFGMKKFRSALADAEVAETDEFVSAVQATGKFFSGKQQELIKNWLGDLDLPPSVADGIEGDQKVSKVLAVKKEAADWTGRAAPVTPGGVGGRWAGKAGKGGVGFKGKGLGKGVRSAGHGIISMDGAAALHGMPAASFGQGQLQAFSGKDVSFEESRGTKRTTPQTSLRNKFQKGTPTLAPMTPGPKGAAEMQGDEF